MLMYNIIRLLASMLIIVNSLNTLPISVGGECDSIPPAIKNTVCNLGNELYDCCKTSKTSKTSKNLTNICESFKQLDLNEQAVACGIDTLLLDECCPSLE